MTTYTVFQDSSMVDDKVSASDLWKHIPAGSILTSGNKVDKETGDVEIRAVYKLHRGGHVTIIQNKKND